jgi:amino acid transporter
MTQASPSPSQTPEALGELRRSLGPVGVMAQAVGTVGLTLTAVINIPQAMRSAGRATWISYVLALAVVLLVGETLVLFRRLPGSAAGIAGYVAAGLGRRTGAAATWVLMLSYGASMLACLVFFGFYLDRLLDHLQLPAPQLAGYLLGGIACVELARRDVKLSARTMLVTEALSVLIVLSITVLVIVQGWGPPDLRAIDPVGDTPSEVGSALMLAVLSFAGFESAASLGGEALRPERAVPQGIRTALLVAGGLFVFWAVFLPEGLSWLPASERLGLDPLSDLAERLGKPGAGRWIQAGALICLFGSSLGSVNALARASYSLAEQRVLPRLLSRVDPRHGTPSAALVTVTLPVIAAGALLLQKELSPSAIFGLFGGFAVLGFLLIYGLVALASLRGELPGNSTRRRWLVGGSCLIAVLAIAVAYLASLAGQQNGMVLAFAALLLLGWLRVLRTVPA